MTHASRDHRALDAAHAEAMARDHRERLDAAEDHRIATGPKHPQKLRAYAGQVGDRIGVSAALRLIAELEEAVSEVEHGT